MKKRILLLFSITALLLTLSGCSNQKDESNNTDSQLEPFHVVLDWYPNAVHGFIYNAIEKGYYEEEGLDVKIQFPSNANDAISLTAAGKADAGIYYLQDVITTRVNQDIPVKSIGSIVQAPLNIILSLKEKNITSPKDLEGKTVGYSGTELSEAIVQYMLDEAGCDVNSVTLIDVGFDLMSSMTTGNVDATIGCMANHEVPAMEKEGFEVNYFFPDDFGIPDYYELIFVTGENQINENKERLAGFLRASKKGFDDMKADPDQTLSLLLDNQNEENFPLDRTVEEKSMEMLLPMMETPDSPFLSQTEALWQENIDWLYEQGLVNKEIKASEVMVDLLNLDQ